MEAQGFSPLTTTTPFTPLRSPFLPSQGAIGLCLPLWAVNSPPPPPHPFSSRHDELPKGRCQQQPWKGHGGTMGFSLAITTSTISSIFLNLAVALIGKIRTFWDQIQRWYGFCNSGAVLGKLDVEGMIWATWSNRQFLSSGNIQLLMGELPLLGSEPGSGKLSCFPSNHRSLTGAEMGKVWDR